MATDLEPVEELLTGQGSGVSPHAQLRKGFHDGPRCKPAPARPVLFPTLVSNKRVGDCESLSSKHINISAHAVQCASKTTLDIC